VLPLIFAIFFDAVGYLDHAYKSILVFFHHSARANPYAEIKRGCDSGELSSRLRFQVMVDANGLPIRRPPKLLSIFMGFASNLQTTRRKLVTINVTARRKGVSQGDAVPKIAVLTRILSWRRRNQRSTECSIYTQGARQCAALRNTGGLSLPLRLGKGLRIRGNFRG
jgi:hypothetical protein